MQPVKEFLATVCKICIGERNFNKLLCRLYGHEVKLEDLGGVIYEVCDRCNWVGRFKEYTIKFKDCLWKGIESRYEKDRQNFSKAIKRYFPDHTEHGLLYGVYNEGDWEYFDAMFVAVTVDCSCGQKLKLTREMLHDDAFLENLANLLLKEGSESEKVKQMMDSVAYNKELYDLGQTAINLRKTYEQENKKFIEKLK